MSDYIIRYVLLNFLLLEIGKDNFGQNDDWSEKPQCWEYDLLYDKL